MVPASLFAAALLPVFPLHAEIDLGPLALRAGTKYKFRVIVESAAGQKEENEIGIGAAANLDDVADVVSIVFRGMEKVAVRQQGPIFTVTEFDGVPVRKVTLEFKDNGPQPSVRWVPRKK